MATFWRFFLRPVFAASRVQHISDIVAKWLYVSGMMPLGTELGLSLGDIVLDGDPALPPKVHSPPIFGPYLLWPNGWMDQDVT